MRRAALLVLLAGCGQEPPPPAPPALPEFPAAALPEPRAPEPAAQGPFPSLEREVPDLDLPPLPSPRPFLPAPAWERLHGRRVAHAETVDPWARSPEFMRNHPSVLGALARLAQLQEEDGSWSPLPACPECGSGADMDRVGTTALAALALLRAGIPTKQGYFHQGQSLDRSLRRGLEWILSDQDVSGTTARRSFPQRGMAATVLVEAGSYTYSVQLRGEATRAMDLLMATPLGNPDSSSLLWAAEAARAAWWSYPPRPGQDWIVRLQAEFESKALTDDPAEAAKSAIFRILTERNKGNRRLADSMDLLLRNKPSGNRVDLVYWREGTRAVYLYDGPSGPKWKAWSEALGPVLDEAGRRVTCPQAACLVSLLLLEFHGPIYPRRAGYRSA